MNDATQIRRCTAALRMTACTCRGEPSVPFTDAPPGFRRSFLRRPSAKPQRTAPASNFRAQILKFPLAQEPKSIKNDPSSMFRLERTPTLYFLQLTQILNDTMFRLEMLGRRIAGEWRGEKNGREDAQGRRRRASREGKFGPPLQNGQERREVNICAVNCGRLGRDRG